MASLEEIELEERSDPSEISDKSRSATTTAATVVLQLDVQNDQSDTLGPKPRSYFEGSRRHTMSSIKQVPCEDDISFLEEVDICLEIPSKLRHLDYPTVEHNHDEDVAKVIRKKFSKLGIDKTAKGITFLSSDHQHSSFVSWEARIEEAVKEENDAFWKKVVEKTNQLSIGRMQAIFEVYTDLLVEKADGSVDQALLWVLRQDIKECCAEVFVTRLLKRNAKVFKPGAADGNAPLHLAAMKGFTNIAKKLIGNGAYVAARNREGQTPLYLAIKGNHCDFAVLMVHNMEPARVRQMFQTQGINSEECQLSLHSLLDEKETMNDLVLAVLDTMMEPLESGDNNFIVYYNILDGDRQGRPPNDPNFEKSHKSCLHKIAKSNNKDVVCHDVVRLLLRRKWKKFARYIFFAQFAYFLTFLASLTIALVLASRKPDPRRYDTPLDVFRGLCEAFTLLTVCYNTVGELNQMRIHYYLLDYYNYLDLPSIVFTFLIIPFRAIGFNVQWMFASLCYLFNGLRAFKYAAVFRSTGAYVQILFQILIRGMIQFGTIFSVFLFSFSGAFYLALRGEVYGQEGTSSCINCNLTTVENGSMTASETTVNTSLNIYPFETSEIYLVWFTGIRVMIEGAIIVDQYFGPNGFQWFGVIIYSIFLFLVIVVLLNLLIAQMSNTYESVQQDAQRSLAINRALIIARVEHNSLLARDFRKFFYESCDVIKNPQGVLESWEVQPINEVNRKLERIERAIKKQNEAIDEMKNLMEMEKLDEQ